MQIPLTARTTERLMTPPKKGNTHKWLAQVAGGVKHVLPPQQCFKFLKRCCKVGAYREVPDDEIQDAVDFAYGVSGNGQHARQTIRWPDANAAAIARVCETVKPLFDGETDTGLRPVDVLPRLYHPGELVCTGMVSQLATIRPVEQAVTDAAGLQFIVPNPMKGVMAMNKRGEPSPRCQTNIKERRYVVAEFDDETLGKRKQAQLVTVLAKAAPLVMVVFSGSKSLHSWFYVASMSPRDQVRFFAAACLLGADQSRWDHSGWLRMPGGLRMNTDGSKVRQQVLFFNPAAIGHVQ